MKKKLLSGLLSMLLAFPSALAIGDGAGVTLRFSAKAPASSGSETLDENAVLQIKSVLEKRLGSIDCDDSKVVVDAENNSVSVTLHENKDGIEDYLSAPGILTVIDCDGKEYLANADVTTAETSYDGNAAALLLTLTEDGKEKLGEAIDEVYERPEGENFLKVVLDGEELATITDTENLDEPQISLDVSDPEFAAGASGIINAGPLPVKLTSDESEPQDTSAEDDKIPDNEPAGPEDNTESSLYQDIDGHWAENDLSKAVELGLLNGSDGLIRPDNNTTLAEAVTILNRALGAVQIDSVTSLNVPASAWYSSEAGKALHIGLVSNGDSRSFEKQVTRAEAFELIARGFSYDGVANTKALDPYPDAASMTAAQKNASAALVSEGVVKGMTDGTLGAAKPLSRAQFITMILRAAPEFVTDESDSGKIAKGALVRLPSVSLSGESLSKNQVFACDTGHVTLSDMDGSSRIVMKGSDAARLSVEKSSLEVLALDPAGSIEASLDETSDVSTLVVPGRGGGVSFHGSANDLQVTSSGREIKLSGINSNTLTVTGSNNIITLDGNVTDIRVNKGAENNVIEVNGIVQTMTLSGKGTKVSGSGKAGTIDKRALNLSVSLEADSVTEHIDTGLAGIKILPGVPDRVTPGGVLHTQFKITGVTEPKVCRAQWLQDGKPIPGYYNPNFELSEGVYSRHTSTFNFTKDMKTSVTMGFVLAYENTTTGETETLKSEVTVPIENYSDDWYYQRDVNRVLKLVSSVYRGNYTTAYARDNDYTSVEKETWINAKGYSSSTQYLCWINRAYQHVNVFQGSKGKWKLIKSFIVGTGASGTPTPTGMTTVSYKSKYGWTTGSYTVRPVIGFYPGSGYAFHSRLCYPGTTTEYDYSSGYPVSHGCVRMLRNDIDWMYNNIPVGTRVVIY